MNREIKFRAWDKINEKWYDHDSLGSIELIGNYTKGGFNFDGFVDHELMQYTGLKDKNGVEIYEGDIVIILEENQLVFWSDEYSGWFVGDAVLCDPLFDVFPIEVIGNIHENHELL